MKDLTKVFIDLSKLSEEQIKSLPQILVKNRQEYTPAFNDNLSASDIVHFHNTWKLWALSVGIPDDKQELTYPEFIKLFEGGEGEKDPYAELLKNADILLNMFTELDSEQYTKWEQHQIDAVQFISDKINSNQ